MLELLFELILILWICLSLCEKTMTGSGEPIIEVVW